MEKSVLKKSNLGIFSLNYFTQGINQSMFTTIIPIYLLQLIGSVDAAEVASLMSIVLLPFGVKFLYGMISDKISIKNLGRRKPWIIGPSIVAGLIWILIPSILTANNAMTLIMILGIIIVIGGAMADTAIMATSSLCITPKNITKYKSMDFITSLSTTSTLHNKITQRS